MKYTFLTLFALAIITATFLAYGPPSLKSDVVELLISFKNQVTYYSRKIPSQSVENSSSVIQKQNKVSSETSVKLTLASTSEDSSQSLLITSGLSSRRNEVNEKISIRDANSRNGANLEDQGFIYVTSTPGSALVKVDDINVGGTPVTIRVSPSGIYKIDVKLKYFDAWQKAVRISENEVTKIHANLKPGTGKLTLISVPEEAEVQLDGATINGNTPLTISNVAAGKHTIYIVKLNREYSGEVEILSGEKKVLNILLSVLRTRLSLDSKPSGASAYLDGVKIGNTPIEVDKVRIGRHQIVLMKNDSLAYVDSIFVSTNNINTYFLKLKRKSNFAEHFSSKVTINSELVNTFAYLDGRFRGPVPIQIDNLRSGEHEILIVRTTTEGSYFYKNKFFIDSHETKDISLGVKEFKLKKRF